MFTEFEICELISSYSFECFLIYCFTCASTVTLLRLNFSLLSYGYGYLVLYISTFLVVARYLVLYVSNVTNWLGVNEKLYPKSEPSGSVEKEILVIFIGHEDCLWA